MRLGAVLAAWAGLALAAGSVGTALAAESCSSFQKTCAARCQQRLPRDKDCMPDHCTPKLTECRATGCWQEGKLYGGALTCNLKKS
ncbi:MAG: hypothetical protein K2P80_14020 [Beijerinckiaceae bacterium]|nr:hypothetical protein [Beijerinckiaceae bacterium]